MYQHLDRFSRIAIRHHLAGASILLWQMLYVSMARCGRFSGYAINTSVLLAQLQISRQGLL